MQFSLYLVCCEAHQVFSIKSPDITAKRTDEPNRGAIAVLVLITDLIDRNMTYLIKYKEFNRDWSSTSYSSPDVVSEDFLIDFFGLHECEDFIIEPENN